MLAIAYLVARLNALGTDAYFAIRSIRRPMWSRSDGRGRFLRRHCSA